MICLFYRKDFNIFSQEKIAESDGVNWEGLAAIIIFYLAVLMVNVTFIILQLFKNIQILQFFKNIQNILVKTTYITSQFIIKVLNYYA